ncbi:hypothetical protein FB45DRAFT_937973 [Roridomyces roridus]|uniref:Ankyrin repeat protein n=1 Tax=Roridomyces roridus TaxID=1738132 RepID=A0AAD7B8Y2_9AGAR|nr:hypothetical protein FB45DRAFT_937973 [Roridomyces roridus]
MTHDDDWRDILQQSDDSATYSDKAAIELLYRACEALTLVEEDGLATIRRPDPAGHAETLLSSDSVPADPREQIANSSPRGEAQIRSSDDVEPSHVDLLGESVPVSVAAIEEGLQAANANLMGTSAASSSRSSVHSEGKRRQEKETEENIRDEDSLASPEIGLHEAGGSPTLPEAQSEVDEGSRRPTPFPDFEGPGASRSEEKRRADDSPIQSAQTPGVQDASSTDGQGWRLDLSTVISLVWKLFKGCRDSSQDFERLANELGALHVALTETRDYMEEYGENYGEELPGHRIERLVMILETCQTALDELDTLHSQYQNLSTQAQRSWNRLRYGQKDLSGIRTTLISTATMLTSFNAILLTTSTARIEKKLQKFLQEVEAGKREGSVVTVQEDDWTVDSVNVWDQVRRELEDVGISPEVVEERHEFILSWVKQAMTEGMIPDVGSTDSLLAPIGDVDEDQGPLERPPTPIPTDAANEKEFISTAARLFGVDKGSTAGPSTIGEQNAPIVDLPGPSTEASSVYSFSTSSSKTLRNSSSRSSIFSISTFTSSKKGSKPRKRILGLIRKLFQKQTAIVKAASEGDIERVERLIKMGMNVNAVDRWGWSALSMCAYGGHAAITRLLLENGADIDNIDVDGDTPLLLATQRGHNEVVALLEEASTEKVRMRASDSSNPVKY